MLEGRGGVLLGRVPGRGGLKRYVRRAGGAAGPCTGKGGAKKGMLEGRGVLLGRVPGGGGLKKVC